MECVQNLFSVKNNNRLLDGACAIGIYKLRVKIRSVIHKVIEMEVSSVLVLFSDVNYQSRERVLSINCVRRFD
jgi:hypothetical protein